MRILLACLIALICAESALASGGKKVARDIYDSQPFNPDAVIPPNYQCGNVHAAISVAMSAPDKNQFETTSEHIDRQQKWAELPRKGLVPFGSLVAFCAAAEVPADLSYNADEKEITVVLWKDMGTIEGKRFVPVYSKLTQKGYGVGENAFGRKIRYRKQSLYESGVAFDEKDVYLSRPRKFGIRSEPKLAPDLMWNLRVAFIGRVSSPYSLVSSSDSPATFDAPIEEISTRAALTMDIEQIWFFNQRTGEVVLKLDGSYGQTWPPSP